MALHVSEQVKSVLQAFLLLILPWIVLILGLIAGIEHVWYFLLAIVWFGSGIVFYGALQ